MSKTISSGSVLLCPVSEFLNRIDEGIVADLCTKDPNNPVLISALPSHPYVLAALGDACGEVESVALMGGKYESVDLQALAAASPPVMATYKLWRIISDLAWVYLWERRPNKNIPSPPSLERSEAWMQQLALGQRIFGFEEVEQAQVMQRQEVTPRDIAQRNFTTYQARRLFGRRADDERFPPRPCP